MKTRARASVGSSSFTERCWVLIQGVIFNMACVAVQVVQRMHFLVELKRAFKQNAACGLHLHRRAFRPRDGNLPDAPAEEPVRLQVGLLRHIRLRLHLKMYSCGSLVQTKERKPPTSEPANRTAPWTDCEI